MQPNRKIGEKQVEMGRRLGKDGCKQTSKESRGGKTICGGRLRLVERPASVTT